MPHSSRKFLQSLTILAQDNPLHAGAAHLIHDGVEASGKRFTQAEQ